MVMIVSSSYNHIDYLHEHLLKVVDKNCNTGVVSTKHSTNLLRYTVHTCYTTSFWFVVGWFMMFNTTFNSISVIWWWSVLLIEVARVPGENH